MTASRSTLRSRRTAGASCFSRRPGTSGRRSTSSPTTTCSSGTPRRARCGPAADQHPGPANQPRPARRLDARPSISGDGHQVAFQSTASNIFPTPTTSPGHVPHPSRGRPHEPARPTSTARAWSRSTALRRGHQRRRDLGDRVQLGRRTCSATPTSPAGIYHVLLCCHVGSAPNELINHIPGRPSDRPTTARPIRGMWRSAQMAGASCSRRSRRPRPGWGQRQRGVQRLRLGVEQRTGEARQPRARVRPGLPGTGHRSTRRSAPTGAT